METEKVRIVSDGTAAGTTLFDENGLELDACVESIEWTLEFGKSVKYKFGVVTGLKPFRGLELRRIEDCVGPALNIVAVIDRRAFTTTDNTAKSRSDTYSLLDLQTTLNAHPEWEFGGFTVKDVVAASLRHCGRSENEIAEFLDDVFTGSIE